MIIWLSCFIPVIVLCFAALQYKRLVALPEGTPVMKQIADDIRQGANTFLILEYKHLSVYALVVAIILAVVLGWYVGVAFLIGLTISSLAGLIGMKAATKANVRVSNNARVTKDIGSAFSVAFQGGSIMGLSVAGLASLGLLLIVLIFGIGLGQLDPSQIMIQSHGGLIHFIPFPMTVSGYALGCSLVALFNRVGGGIFTKAADMGADLVGKTELALEEDDPRNPATIADNVGDNVGDIAGLGSDLLESYVGAIISSIVLILHTYLLLGAQKISSSTALHLTYYPLIFVLIGLISSFIGIVYILRKKNISNPQKELNTCVLISSGFTLVFTFLFSWFYLSKIGQVELQNLHFTFGIVSPWVAAAVGVIIGILIGLTAEYYTSEKLAPTKELSNFSKGGVSILITKGLALGMKSVLLTVTLLSVGILASYKVAGLYGVAMAALGMLSFIATTVTIDSFGPIVDNAGGIAQMAGLSPEVRTITDTLDSIGNTTAAVGKGFAIGSAALAALALFASYIYAQLGPLDVGIGHLDTILILNIMEPRTIAGAIFGGALPFFFSAYLIDAVVNAANKMVQEVRRQFREIPGLMEGTAKADSKKCIEISTQGALRQIRIPILIAVGVPIAAGFLLGPNFVGGILLGTTISGIMLAIFCANSGGAWDNAKKRIEAGEVEGEHKGSEAHKAAVIGDTVGDPLKDTVGPSLDILIKIMAITSLITVSIFKVIHLF
ncbi:MAG: sodium-translocating pyrophosphatase [Caldisericia bacterium]|nr:sodium-translocating pyrophosphatase [Caldisericia bacterium]